MKTCLIIAVMHIAEAADNLSSKHESSGFNNFTGALVVCTTAMNNHVLISFLRSSNI